MIHPSTIVFPFLSYPSEKGDLPCSFEGAVNNNALNHSGEYDGEATPVPIPNTVVKLSHADDIWLEATRENRSRRIFYAFLFLL